MISLALHYYSRRPHHQLIVHKGGGAAIVSEATKVREIRMVERFMRLLIVIFSNVTVKMLLLVSVKRNDYFYFSCAFSREAVYIGVYKGLYGQ